MEIELSAFLRLLGTRDLYRQVYQARAELVPVLDFLYRHDEMPRSVRRCLRACLELIGHEDSAAALRTVEGLSRVIDLVDRMDWSGGVSAPTFEALSASLQEITDLTLGVHEVITDGFINHQIVLE